MPIYLKKQAQIGALLFDEVFIKVSVKYFNYSNVFLAKNILELSENFGMNKHIIKPEKDKQLSFRSIYSQEPVKLETLKTYIKTNLANGFIWPSKSLAGTLICLIKSQIKIFAFI